MHDPRADLPNAALDIEQLAQRVAARLRGQVQSFCVVLGPDGLILRGVARSYHAKQLAQHAVMEAAVWRIAANEIEVAYQGRKGRGGGP